MTLERRCILIKRRQSLFYSSGRGRNAAQTVVTRHCGSHGMISIQVDHLGFISLPRKRSFKNPKKPKVLFSQMMSVYPLPFISALSDESCLVSRLDGPRQDDHLCFPYCGDTRFCTCICCYAFTPSTRASSGTEYAGGSLDCCSFRGECVGNTRG
jgi:hypothetical protein